MISFHGHGLLINIEMVHEHLLSDESLFRECTLMDFFETLQVLQFSRTAHSKKVPDSNKIFHIFVNPNFEKHGEVPNDFYKRPIDITKCNALKGTKRMTNVHYINLFNRIMNRAERKFLEVTPYEFARLRIDYEFQRRDSLILRQENVVEHDIDEPQYLKDNEIAGYYGNVPLDALKDGFGNYFPIYQTEPPIDSNEMTFEEVKIEVASQEIIVDVVSSPVKLQSVPLLADATPKSSRNDETEQPRKRKYIRRNLSMQTRKSARITTKETEDALTNLQKEFDSI